MKRLFLLLILTLLLVPTLRATHAAGGEITWKCLPNGQFKFTLKAYRDCSGSVYGSTQQLRVHGYPGLTTIALTQVGPIIDITPQCYNPALGLYCIPTTHPNNTFGSASEYTYESQPITLVGVPPPSGWIFYWSEVARNSSIVNFTNASGNIGLSTFVIRSIMYPFTPQGSIQNSNVYPCYDSSPDFNERPLKVVCAGLQFSYNSGAFDSDLDSLYYSIAPPLGNLGGSPNWPVSELLPASGYSVSSPMPGPVQNPLNVPMALDLKTGHLSLTNFTVGGFILCLKVESWRCGQLIAEVFRDIQFLYVGICNVNLPPIYSVSGTSFTNMSGNLWVDTVLAGDLVNFSFQASDLELLIPSNPNSVQSVLIEASGGQFGDNFTSTTSGCLQPPCATLTPAPPISNPMFSATDFSWQTNCDHLESDGCGVSTKDYAFVFNVQDNACAIPASNSITIVVRIIPDTSGITILSSGSTTFCEDDSVTLTAQVPIGTTLQWMRNGVSIYGETSAQLVANQPGNYFIQTYDSSGCAYNSQSVLLNVLQQPIAQIFSPSSTSICVGDSLELICYSEPGYSYQWKLNGLSILGAIDTSYYATQSGNYTVEVVNSNGCNLLSQSTLVNVLPLPLAQINAPDTIAFCPNDTLELSCFVEVGNSYQWRLNGLAIPGANDTVVSITQSGLYSVELVDSNGCSAISSEVFADVFAPISSISGPLVVSTNQAVTYSVVNTIGHNYTWSVTNGAMVGGQGTNSINVVWMAGQTGTLKVIESNAFCTDSTSITVQSVLNSEEHIANRFVQLFPNPSQGLIQIQTIELGTKLTVYNNFGQSVFESHLKNRYNTIDLRDLADGTYLVIFQHDERLQVERILISR